MDSICTMDSKLLPLLAAGPSMSLRVMVFMAVNCIEFTMPKQARCSSSVHTGWPGAMKAKLAMMLPSASVLATSTRR